VRKTDCGQVTDGAAAIILASPERAKAEYARKRGIPLESIPRIKGWGHRCAPIDYGRKIRASEGQPYVFPQVKRAIDDARARAGIGPVGRRRGGDPRLLLHDRIHGHRPSGPDRARRELEGVEAGDIEMGGKLPINPSGGLIGPGPPGRGDRRADGAGRVQTDDGHGRRLSGRGGAKTVQTLNIGGSTTTTVSFVVGT
jgi:acetyl-CoA C-acetyltransferase